MEQPAIIPKKTTFDPEAEPNRNDSGELEMEKSPMLLPDNKNKIRVDSSKNVQ